jgi:HEAT repeat protein
MRVLSFLTATLLAFAAGAVATTAAQKGGAKDGKTDKTETKKAPQELTDIGGKSIDEWIKEIGSTDRSESSVAIKTVLLFPPEQAKKAIPALLDQLRKHKKRAVDASVRVNAPTALVTLLSNIKDPPKEQVKEAIELLTWMLGDQQIVVRYRAIQALALCGPAAKEAIPKLIVLTKDFPTWETRHAATVALGVIAQPTEKDKAPPSDVIQALYVRLHAKQETSSQVRLAAIQSLRMLRVPESKSTLTFETEMEPVTRDPKPLVRIAAHSALYKLNPKLKTMRRAAVAKLLTSHETAVRLAAIFALGQIGADSKDRLADLERCVADRDSNVAGAALHAIAEIGRTSVPARGFLSELIQNPKAELPIRVEAARALGGIGADAKSQRGMFAQILGDPKQELSLRIESARALGNMGEEAADQMSTLIKTATDKELPVAMISILCIVNMGDAGRRAVPALNTIAEDKNQPDQVRRAAREAADHLFKLKKGPTKKGADR